MPACAPDGEHSSAQELQSADARGLAPVGVGLIIAGVISLFRVAGSGVLGGVIACLTGAMLYGVPKVPVLLVLSLGA